MKGFITAALLAGSLAGCATMMPGLAPPVDLTTPWSADEHKAWEGTGSGSIKGQAFLKQNGGGVVTCAGNKVVLMPDTPYYREALAILKAGRRVETGRDTSYLRKEAMCDAEGRFEFQDLPIKPWIVAADVAWMVGYARQGGGLTKSVTPKEAGVTTVLLTDADR